MNPSFNIVIPKIPYRDLSVKDPALKKELLETVDRVLSHGRLLLGPEVENFENLIGQFCRSKYVVGMNSGTDSLYLGLRALGIGPGDEVITTPLSWIATMNAIVLVGATPVFVDIKDDLNINEDLIETVITARTKAIMPVHFTGLICDMPKIQRIATKHNLFVIEDAAQAFGAHLNGISAGAFGKLGCFSMNPMKVLSAYGEAGAVITDDGSLYQKLLSLRYGGTVNKEDCHFPSLNGRLDALHAALLVVNMKFFDKTLSRQKEIARQYTEALQNVVTCPQYYSTNHVYYSYTLQTPRRDELREYLLSKDIETKIQHPILMPYHTAYKGKYQCHIPVAERLVKQILCIPNAPHLSNDDVETVIATVKDFFRNK